MALTARDLHFAYPNGQEILRGLSLRLAPGTCLAILGENGSGKSTLLKALAGLLPTPPGALQLDGTPLDTLPPRIRTRHVAFVPQSPSLPDCTTLEAVLLGRLPHLQGEPTPADLALARDLLRQMKLEEKALRPLDTLSGGEQQRAALAQALAQQPRVLLLDEPTSNLDLRAQREILSLLQELLQQGKTAIALAIHDVNLAQAIATEFLLLKEGKALAQGTPRETLTPALLSRLYGVPVQRLTLPGSPTAHFLFG